ncbi:cupin domain-containing protein [Methylobrevis pamukkalensis]|uniref:N-acetyldiaminobutyrate dehydratase n=1 Tax=Methylobrevis pamukkalensis TaxID=1439726 RepID=A0A1E3H7K3_9HYPH|nr:hypothetical protein [Methylobrevis pamukkalensis]ODN72318.1 hypothetical protein A6302_00383 [Methylobrevis pamukkalensis]
MTSSANVVRVIDTSSDCPEIPIIERNGRGRVVLWPGNGARFRSFQLISLTEGGSTIPLSHASDCVYYVISGTGRIVDLGGDGTSELVEGTMVHIDAGDSYRIETDARIEILGGPCPPDAAFYAGIAALEGAL